MRVILYVDYGNTTFINTYTKLKPDILKQAKKAFGELTLLDIDKAPAKLHLHALTDKEVRSALDPKKKVPVYTMHITTSDSHKASFTYENGAVYMRACGTHDDIDKNP